MPTPTVYKFSVAPYSAVLGPDDNIWLFGNGITVISKSGVLVETYSSGYTIRNGFVISGDLWTFAAESTTVTYLASLTSTGAQTNVVNVDSGSGPNSTFVFYISGVFPVVVPSPFGYTLNEYDSAGTNVLSVGVPFFGQWLIEGPDGNIWSSYNNDGYMVTVSGTVTTYTNLFPSGNVGNGVYTNINAGSYMLMSDFTTGAGLWKVTTAPVATKVSYSSTSKTNSLAIGADGFLYVLDNDTTTNAYGTLWQIDLSTLTVVGSVACPAVNTGDSSPWQCIYSDGTYLWMVNQQSSVCRWSGLVPRSLAQLVMPL